MRRRSHPSASRSGRSGRRSMASIAIAATVWDFPVPGAPETRVIGWAAALGHGVTLTRREQERRLDGTR